MRSLGFLLLLACAASAAPPGLELPKEASGDVAAFIRVEAKTPGRNVRWVALDSGLALFPVELLKDSKTAVVTSAKPGRYRLLAVTAAGDEISEPAVCTVVVGEAPAPPGPGPKPPEPKPDGTFDRVLILYETSELGRMPAAQDAILTSRVVHEALKSRTLRDTDNPNGAWRVWDKDVNASGESKPWQDLLARPRTAVPWIILANSAGVVHEGPLPASVPATLDLLAKFTPRKKAG